MRPSLSTYVSPSGLHIRATKRRVSPGVRPALPWAATLALSLSASSVLLRAAQAGTGIIAGGPMRAVFEVLGVQDVVAKSIGSSNPHNMIKATFSALTGMQAPRSVAQKRGKRVADVLGGKRGSDDQAAAS